jgi:hypothetical protein
MSRLVINSSVTRGMSARMLIRMIDLALNCTFFTIHGLARYRNYLTFRKPTYQEEEARLIVEWLEARHMRDALKAELNVPTFSRLYDAQATLLRTTKAADEKCHYLLVKLRAHHRV